MPIAPQITNTPIDITSTDFAISAVSYTSSTATYTASGHTFSAGDTVIISGIVPAGYSGTFTVTSIVAGTSFTCANTTNLAVTTATGDAFSASPTDFTYGDVAQVRTADVIDVNTAFSSAQASAAAALATANTAEADAQTALSNAATAYTTAVNSLQPSAYAIQNPTTKQLTSINATGLTVYTGSSATSGARVVMNSIGLAGYDSSGNATFSIVASTGQANFAGSITGSNITGSTLNIGGNFYVDGSTGLMTGTNVTLIGNITATSATITGKIVASDTSTLAGWTLSGTKIQANSGTTYLDSSTGSIATLGNITAGGTISTAFTNISAGANLTGFGLIITGSGQITGNMQIDTMAVVGSPTSANYNTVLISKTSSGATLGRLYGYNNLSSAIYKENITDFATRDYLGIINKMRPVTFNYKADQVVDPESVIMGMIAEDIDAIKGAQDLVEYAEDKPSAIRYDKIPLFIIKAIQEISARLTALETK